jgi:hypothetical protein
MDPLDLLQRPVWQAGSCMWTVVYTDDDAILSPGEGGERCAGMADPTTQVIFIRMSMSPNMKLRTLFHELAHAYGLSEDGAEAAEVAACLLLENLR